MRRDLCVAPRVFSPSDVSVNADALERLCRAQGVEVAVLFGSVAEGAGAGGDLDLAIQCRGADADLRLVLYDELCRLFRADNIDVMLLD